MALLPVLTFLDTATEGPQRSITCHWERKWKGKGLLSRGPAGLWSRALGNVCSGNEFVPGFPGFIQSVNTFLHLPNGSEGHPSHSQRQQERLRSCFQYSFTQIEPSGSLFPWIPARSSVAGREVMATSGVHELSGQLQLRDDVTCACLGWWPTHLPLYESTVRGSRIRGHAFEICLWDRCLPCMKILIIPRKVFWNGEEKTSVLWGVLRNRHYTNLFFRLWWVGLGLVGQFPWTLNSRSIRKAIHLTLP